MEEKGDVSNEPIQNKNEEPTLEQPTNDLPSLISDIEEQLTDALFTKVLQSYWPRYCRLSSQGWPETTYVHPNLEYAGFASKVWEKDSFLWLKFGQSETSDISERYGWPTHYFLCYQKQPIYNAHGIKHFEDYSFRCMAGLALYKYYSTYALTNNGLIGKARKPIFEYIYTGKNGTIYSNRYWHSFIKLVQNKEPYLEFLNGVFCRLSHYVEDFFVQKCFDDACYMASHQGFGPRISREKYKEFIYLIDCIDCTPLSFEEPRNLLLYIYETIIYVTDRNDIFVKTKLLDHKRKPSPKKKVQHNKKRPLKQFPWREI